MHPKQKLFTLHKFYSLLSEEYSCIYSFIRRLRRAMQSMKPDDAKLRGWMLSIGKIIEGALSHDERKVRAYAMKLSEQFRADDQARAADRIDELVGSAEAISTLSLARSFKPVAIPVDSEARLPVADELLPARAPIVLEDDAAEQINRFLRYVRAADRLAEHGVGISPSMLLYGPPGCGKTQLAKHVAASLELPLITARADALISSYLGSTAKNLRSLFDHAASRPCVLFLDELDAIGKMRDDERELGELKRVVISLLQNIDALDRHHVILAATNHEHLLDPALWRRFAFHIKIERPSIESRRRLLALFAGKYATESALEIVAAAAEGMSGADLRELVNQAIRDAVLAERDSLDTVDLITAIARRQAKQAPRDRDQLIREIHRLSPKLRQDQLARAFRVSQATISRILNGEDRNG
jgi:ATP-dependent Clp protease ATP-binding subunit ClpA